MSSTDLIGGSGIDDASGSTQKNGDKKGLFRTLGDSINRQKHALMVAGGLAVGAGSLAVAPGCTNEIGNGEGPLGKSHSALLGEWAPGTVGNNACPHTYWTSATEGYRIWSSDRSGVWKNYISSTSDKGVGWTSASEIQTASGEPLNDPSSNDRCPSICFNGGCGTGKIITSSDRLGTPDMMWWSWSVANKEASDGVIVPLQDSELYTEDSAAVNSNGTKMVFGRFFGGKSNLMQTDISNPLAPTNPTAIVGLNNLSYTEVYPWFYINDTQIAYSSDKPGSGNQGTNVWLASGYNFASSSVTASVPLTALNNDYNQGGGSTDDFGETCIGTEKNDADSGTSHTVIECFPNVPGPDGGTGGGGAGGTGAGGMGGVAGAPNGGSGGVAGAPTGGAGGSAGNETGGTGGVAGAPNGGSGGVAGAPNGGSGGVAGSETGGSGGVAGAPNGGSGGVAGAPNGGSGGSPEGGTGGTAGSGGGTPECPITVTVNSGDCEVLDCANLAQGGVVTMKATNANCDFGFEGYANFHFEGTGDNTFQAGTLSPIEKVGNEWKYYEDSNYVPKALVKRVLPNGGTYILGLLGTDVGGDKLNASNGPAFRTKVTESDVVHKVCKGDACLEVSAVSFNKGSGVQPGGEPNNASDDTEVVLLESDLVALSEQIGQTPDAGPATTPPETGDDGGCNISAVSPKDIAGDINGFIGLVLAGGAMAYRRSRREEE